MKDSSHPEEVDPERLSMIRKTEWKRAAADIFWGEIAPYDHVLQLYENESTFLDALTGFIGGGISAGECVIVIATKEHLEMLEHRLSNYGIHVGTLVEDERYIPLNANEILSKFMVNGWPDADLFEETISSLIQRGLSKGRRLRAFGEMVAILWEQGFNGATVQLEHLWNSFCAQHKFSLFCAYPKAGFTQDMTDSIDHICNCHTKMIDGTVKQLRQVVYQDLSVGKGR